MFAYSVGAYIILEKTHTSNERDFSTRDLQDKEKSCKRATYCLLERVRFQNTMLHTRIVLVRYFGTERFACPAI